MSLQTAVLQGGVALTTGSNTIYTVPTGKSAWVKRAVFTNTTGATIAIAVAISRAGGFGMAIISSQALTAGSAYVSPELSGLAMNAGDAILASATAIGINAFVSGLTT